MVLAALRGGAGRQGRVRWLIGKCRRRRCRKQSGGVWAAGVLPRDDGKKARTKQWGPELHGRLPLRRGGQAWSWSCTADCP